LNVSVEAAITTRVTAITAAGSPPTPPAGYNGTAWIAGFQAANETYRTSVANAQATYATSLSTATTATARQAARGALETALGNALSVRATAMASLGPAPTHPGSPS
jgi:hypothetical protein